MKTFLRIKWENLAAILLTITLIMLISICEGKSTDYLMIGSNAVMLPYSYFTLKEARKEMKKYGK